MQMEVLKWDNEENSYVDTWHIDSARIILGEILSQGFSNVKNDKQQICTILEVYRI